MVTQISDWNDLDAAIQGQNGSNETGSFELVAHLDKDTAGYSGIGDSWTPCGQNVTGSNDDGFEGTFDGNDYVIRDLVIDDSGITGDGPVGLIGDTDGPNGTAEIKNVSVIGEITTTKNFGNVGMVVGSFEEGNVLKSCLSGGVIDAPNADSVGGVVGFHRADVKESYTTVDVTGNSDVGGFAGTGIASDIARSYAAGSVTASGSVGGFIGLDGANATQTDCFWDTEATGQSTSDGDATGLTTAEMTGSSATSNLTNFDFTNVWKTVEEGANAGSDGYPYLRGPPVNAQTLLQDARFGNFSVTVTGTNSPVNADGDLTLNIEVTNNGSYKAESVVELIVEEA